MSYVSGGQKAHVKYFRVQNYRFSGTPKLSFARSAKLPSIKVGTKLSFARSVPSYHLLEAQLFLATPLILHVTIY